MKTSSRLLLIACLALPFVAACQKEEKKEVAAETAALSAPKTSDENAWNAYLTDVVKRNLDGVSGSTYVYVLPAPDSPTFQRDYDLMLEKSQADMSRGILEGNLVAFGSPDSAKTADLAVASFSKVDPATMKGVKFIFIGATADNERVKAAVTPAGVNYIFVEAK
ncbi:MULTISPECIES: hypothetical protein [Lysobacter]|jgi:hypothetical protein|uniref:Secreted protein n=1 Tax=Lysobacter gummosus TaxID=262324 RepID=A0ABY3XB77_9GAMM|nr:MULTISPECIES: hypothetical protein [Lysobacter]ALN92420.1 putative secreted protein [Lysobacter gummosus]UJB20681.1 hypothetical protein L1A79_06290 [Lysobacter capsici]UJQ30205.1 hypothetical protein L2D09_08570 [Lysobacter gummosus]UNP28002.1 hypothetical protein MOV92_16035 [Lysobacter gummosus]